MPHEGLEGDLRGKRGVLKKRKVKALYTHRSEVGKETKKTQRKKGGVQRKSPGPMKKKKGKLS